MARFLGAWCDGYASATFNPLWITQVIGVLAGAWSGRVGFLQRSQSRRWRDREKIEAVHLASRDRLVSDNDARQVDVLLSADMLGVVFLGLDWEAVAGRAQRRIVNKLLPKYRESMLLQIFGNAFRFVGA